MDNILSEPAKAQALIVSIKKTLPGYKVDMVGGVEKIVVGVKIWLHIFLLVYKNYRSLKETIIAFKKLLKSTGSSYAGRYNIKLIKNDKKYFYNLYTPGFPSIAYDNFIRNMINRMHPCDNKTNKLSFIFFAITRKCPLNCEHCFEAENLNYKETFTLDELKKVVTKFQQEDLAQFHLSGGEPLVRIKDLENMIESANKKSEFWVLTSGFNLTAENAVRLKNAGATGVVISLDHYDTVQHDSFRKFPNAYNLATEAVGNAREVGLTVAATICATKDFVTWNNLMLYANCVKSLGVHFIQILEPKAVGAYKGKNVGLSQHQLNLLEKFYTTLNSDPAYKDYPIIVYHGYHQRRDGCFSAGYSNLYIDSAGFVNACPFCSTKSYNIKDVLESEKPLNKAIGSCNIYDNQNK